ncbi:hypothetical protein GF382_02370, partial [Candidatus Falkowbacteria bacterium]|nr:hypothetical protein [Candidatus Falkowbacteria bacterium]
MKNIFKICYLKVIIICGIFFFVAPAMAMPVGTLLYRTSGGGQMYGYNTDLILDGTKINCGHTGMYAGKDKNGDDVVLEAVNNGIQLTKLKYFVNSANSENFIGAKIPESFQAGDIDKIKQIRDFLTDQHLEYDIDFGQQKGPDSGEFTCVGVAEKIYESLNFGKEITSLAQLEYTPSRYYIDITPDGYDNENIYNDELEDVFSQNKEFSKISKRNDLIGLAGNGLGK